MTSGFEPIALLNTRFHKLTVNDLITYITSRAKLPQKTVIGHVNVRGMNFSWELDWYRDFLNTADLVFCDGFGVLLAAKLLGFRVQSQHRMTCPDYIENLAIACEQENVSLFLLAGKPGVTDKAIDQMKAIAPKLKVSGHHGYFQKEGEENRKVIDRINDFKPDVLYLGFGMPLQEKWIMDNKDRVDARVFLPLGACLDFYTGTVYRGPKWATSRGLEWMTRLITEPTRLWDRYVIGNPTFFYRIVRHYVSSRFSGR